MDKHTPTAAPLEVIEISTGHGKVPKYQIRGQEFSFTVADKDIAAFIVKACNEYEQDKKDIEELKRRYAETKNSEDEHKLVNKELVEALKGICEFIPSLTNVNPALAEALVKEYSKAKQALAKAGA